MPVKDEKAILDANAEYCACNFKKVEVKREGPTYAIVTCMDAWIHEADAFGIELGEAHIIRNAGADAREALRSLILSQQILGTTSIMVVKHTRCGMLDADNSHIQSVVKENCHVSTDIDFRPQRSPLEDAVIADVEYLRNQPLIPAAIRGNVGGYIYDLDTGKLQRIT